MTEKHNLERLRAGLSDRYTLGNELGRGGMATVYEAHDIKHNRSVAIKVLLPEFGATLGTERFHREIGIEAQLQHPNILALFDSGQVDEFLYYVMPLADGGSLRDRLEQEQQLPLEDAVRITRDVGDALAHAHRRGYVHRDVKPANILLSSGRAMISDFGIARAFADVDAEALTDSGIAVGTPGYMSPEQATGNRRLDQRSDVYSLGCVLFEMLAGEPPFTGRTVQAILARQISEKPPSLEVVRPDLPPHVTAAIGTSLVKVAADRFETVDRFLEALEQPGAVATSGVTEWWRGWKGVVAGAIAVSAIGLGWWSTRPDAIDLSLNKIAVFPLAERGVGVANSGEGVGVMYLIEAALEHADPLRFIDVTRRLTERQLADPELITAAAAREIAGTEGAAFYLQGVVLGHRDSTTVILRAYDVLGDSLIDQSSAAATAGVPLHQIGIDAIKGLLPAFIDPTRDVDLTPLRNRQPDAIALWIQGERAYRHSNFASALDLYARALSEDSALVLAAVKGAQAAHWIHDNSRGQALVELALSRDSLLPRRHVVFARGLRAYFTGQADSAVRRLEEALALDPEWQEAATALGEVYYHLLPTASGPLDSLAEASFARAAASDSGFAPPLFHLAEAYLRRADIEQSDRILDRFRAAEPDPSLLVQLGLMRTCVADPGDMDWSESTQLNALGVLQAGKSLSAAGYQHECAEGAFRAVLDAPTTTRSERWGAFLGLQGLLIATERDGEAKLLIDSVAVRTGVVRSLYVLGTLAGARMSEPAAELEAYARETYGPDYAGLSAAEPLWVMAAWHQQQADSELLDAINRKIATLAGDRATSRDRLLAEAVAARVALYRDTTEGIELLRGLIPSRTWNLDWGFSEALPPERLLLARLLLQRGEYRESIRAASVFDHPEPIMFLPYIPLSLAIRYDAARALGNDAAAETYRVRLERLSREDLVDVQSQ